MQVRVTNVTDGPNKKPREVRMNTKRLRPGAWMDVPIQFIDDKARKLEQSGDIIIGKLPAWYADYEARRKVRNLTNEEVDANAELKAAHQKSVAHRKHLKEEAQKALDVVADVVAVDSTPAVTPTTEPPSEGEETTKIGRSSPKK